MSWKDAVRASRHGCAVAFVEKGHALRLVNATGKTFRIDSPHGKPMESANSKRMLGRLDWKPVVEIPQKFKYFAELMEMAHIRVRKNEATLHAGQRGLAAMIAEWRDRLKTLLAGVEELREIEYSNPELPNKLEAISAEALAMRAML